DAVDVTAAEAWLEQSDLDTLRERAIAASSEADRAVWQQAVDHEQTGAERIRGGLNRAGLALAGLDRLEEAQALVETMIVTFAAPVGMDLERNLSQIEQEMNLANSRRAQIALDLNQRNQLL